MGYKNAQGFRADYGDYGDMAVMNNGETFAVWGEGYSYYGTGGTWYNLKTVSLPPASFGQWHTFSAVKQDNPDGSVLLTGYRDGVQTRYLGIWVMDRFAERPRP